MFVRRYYFSDGISDIASRFGITNHAVSVKLMRLRGRLKKHLIKEGFEI
jgi:RNA polymerase sigma-70 factor (ECF subfamily)